MLQHEDTAWEKQVEPQPTSCVMEWNATPFVSLVLHQDGIPTFGTHLGL